MRQVRRSHTAVNGLEGLLAQGLPKFGWRVIGEKVEKHERVDHTIETYLTRHSQNGVKLPKQHCYRHDVSGTPFAVICTFDDATRYVHGIIHGSQDTRALHPSDVEW